jgi:hypothetical protein
LTSFARSAAARSGSEETTPKRRKNLIGARQRSSVRQPPQSPQSRYRATELHRMMPRMPLLSLRSSNRMTHYPLCSSTVGGRGDQRPKSARLQWHRRRGPVCGSRRSRLDCRIRRENYPKCWQLLTAGSQSRLLRSRRASSRHRAHGLSADRAPRRPAQTGLRGPAAAAVRPPGPCGRVSCARAADADCAPRRRDRAPCSADRAPRFPPPNVSPRVRPAV